MLDDFRNLFGDMLSGKMKDSEIALTKKESDIFRLKAERLLDEATKLRDERVVLISKLEFQRLQLEDKDSLIADLTAKLNKHEPVNERIEDPTHEVLKLLFKVQEGLDMDSIRTHLGMDEGVAMFHLDTLKGLDFIGHKRGREAFFGIQSDHGMHFPRGASAMFFIKPKGRAYIMKNG